MELGHPVTPPAALLKFTPSWALRHKPLRASESCPSHVVGLDVEPENRGPRSGSGPLDLGQWEILSSLASISCFCSGETCIPCCVIDLESTRVGVQL